MSPWPPKSWTPGNRERFSAPIGELLRQRIFGIAAGYEDCNDSARMDADPAMALARGLERSAVRSLKRRHRRASRIVIDLDPSVDPAHGVQQGVLFNGF
ncbi:MAG: hypothetical protein GY930_04660, partial [bacterium]|nr:hypothetical protein [bacterium]